MITFENKLDIMMLLPPLCKFDIWRILKLHAPDHSFNAQIILESIRYEVGPDDPIGYTKQYSNLNYLVLNAYFMDLLFNSFKILFEIKILL